MSPPRPAENRVVRMETPARLLDAGLMIALPLVLGAVAARRYDVPWRLFGWGAVTYVGSQVVHLPLLDVMTRALLGADLGPLREHPVLVNAALLGVAAGVCEEGARYLGYRYLVPGARSWEKGVMLGLGHGGAEAIILGTIAGAVALRLALEGTPAPAAREIGAPAVALLGAVERLFAIANHVGMSVMVLQVFLRRRWRWLLAAIGWHTALDGTTVALASRVSPFAR